MGNPLFGVNISGIIAQNIGPGVLDAVLTKVTSGTRDAANPTGGTDATVVNYACKGFVDRQRRQFANGDIWREDRETVILIGDTISGGTVAPEPGDRVTVEGTDFVIPESASIDRDPAAATYTFQVARY